MSESNIDSAKVLYSAGKDDERDTPRYAVLPLLKYIPVSAVIWCPFDTKRSEFVRVLSKTNKVITSHLHRGQNFLNYEPAERWDMIISNPPFTGKRHIFERALSFNKPFALLMSLTWLNDAASKTVFMDANCQMQLLMFDRRIRFSSPDGRPNNKITFSSAYFCRAFLPNDIVTERLTI